MKKKFIFSKIKKINQLFFFKAQQKGMALIMVLSTIVFIILLIQETVFETQIEYRSAIAELDSLRAYYAAKAGMEINILRVKNYVKITTLYSQKMEPFRAYIDLIYQFPFQWPPPVPGKLNAISRDEFSKIKEDSLLQDEFITVIEPENGRININDLASPIPSLRKWTFQTLFRLIFHLQLTDQKLNDEIGQLNIITVLHNVTDWVDPDSQQGLQRSLSEKSLYDHETLPPNRSFISLEELRQVAEISDALYKAMTPFITIYGEKGLNINAAPAELIQALHDDFPIELAREIAAITSNPLNPFVFTKQTFSQFLNERGFSELERYFFPPKKQNNTSKEEQPVSYINFDAPYNFRMTSIGRAGNSQKTITATYFHTPNFIKHFNTLMKEEKKRVLNQVASKPKSGKTGNQGSNPKSPTAPDSPSNQNQKPIIIYWKESF